MGPKPVILLLSGWAQNPSSLDSVFSSFSSFQILHFDYTKFSSADACFDALRKLNINPIIIVGWSLGGQLACRLIEKKIFNPELLILISTPFQFVKDSRIMAAMPLESFKQFRNNFTSNSFKTLEKFSLLMMLGDEKRAKELIDNLYIDEENYANLVFWLDELNSFSCYDINFSDFPRTLIFHGKGDVVVNVLQAEVFAKKIENHHLEILSYCGHCPHISNLNELKKIIAKEKVFAIN